MKKLIVVRHGQYGDDGHLNKQGREQMERLAAELKSRIKGGSVLVLSSCDLTARESAEVLAAAFGVGFEVHDVLWSSASRPVDLPKTLELVKSVANKADVLVLVTHLEYSEEFPEYYAKEEWGTRRYSRELRKGEAWLIDCDLKSMTRVP